MVGTIWNRGGRPHHQAGTTKAATVEEWELGAPTMHLYFANTHASESIKITLTSKADADAGLGITVEPRTTWALDVECTSVWTQSTNPATFEITTTARG